MLYLKPFSIALVASIILTFFIRKIALKFNVTAPKGDRHIHKKTVPLFGGVAMIFAFILAILSTKELVISRELFGMLLGFGIILIVGIWDDIKEISWRIQLFFQFILALIIIAFGVRVDYLTNPFGGAIRLDQIQFSVLNSSALFGTNFEFSVFGSLFIIFWIVGMINVFNWLDGIDGLSGGVGVIGAVVLFFLCLNPIVDQPPIAILAIAFVGAVLGFLVFNFPPAKIFMGTSGSMFLGFTLGTLAIFSGAKIATAVLVMGFPILDGFWVIVQRLKSGVSPFKGDKRHLHYKLISLGFSQRQIILLIYFLCGSFGTAALFLQSIGKLIALLFLVASMILVAFVVSWFLGRKKELS